MAKIYKYKIESVVYLMAESDEQALERVKKLSFHNNALLPHTYEQLTIDPDLLEESEKPKYPFFASEPGTIGEHVEDLRTKLNKE